MKKSKPIAKKFLALAAIAMLWTLLVPIAGVGRAEVDATTSEKQKITEACAKCGAGKGICYYYNTENKLSC